MMDEKDLTPVKIGRLGENDSRPIPFFIGDIKKKFPSASFTLLHKRPTDTAAYPVNSAYYSVTEKYLVWTPQSGDLTAEGIGELQIKATKDSKVIKTRVFYTEIGRALDDSAEPPEPWESWVDQFEDMESAAEEAADDAEEAAEDSEAYAVGKRGGTDVGDTDPAYHNNAKYYSEQASGSASSAAGSATTAGNAATAAQSAVNNFAPDYSTLTFPIAKGTICSHSGAFYEANQDISTSEAWTAAHWTATNIGDQLQAQKSAIDGFSTATASDVDKLLSPKTVTNGKVTEWQYKTPSQGSVVDDELNKNSSNPVENSVIAEKFEDYDDVLLMRTNQLLDYKNCTQHNATMSSAAGMSTSTHGKVAIVPISVDANTTVTVHRTIVGKRFSIGLSTSENPAIGESIRAYTEGNNNAELSLTATSSDKTLLIYYYLDTQDTSYTAEQLLSAIMVNYGAYIGYEPYLADAFISKKESEYSLVLGEEMFPSSAPTWEGDGWQENTSKQYTHISGGDYQPLKISIPQIKADTPYLLEFDIESNTSTGSPDDSNAVYPSLRGSTPFSIYYGYTGNVHYSFTIFTGTSGSLATTTLDFQPCSATVPSIRGRSFDGTIKNISLKEVLSVRNTNHFLLDQNGKKTVMLIQTEESLRNTLIGFESGRYVSTGYENVALGNKALRRLTSGYWNVGIGAFALEKCAEGSRNIAIGYNALQENTGGDRNIAIGSYALCRNWGFRNVAIGADCLWYNTKGYQNAAIGMATLHSNTEGNNNAAYGVHALHDNVTGNENVGMGARAGYHSTGDKNTAVGYDADITAGKSNAIAIGHGARATKTNQIVTVYVFVFSGVLSSILSVSGRTLPSTVSPQSR